MSDLMSYGEEQEMYDDPPPLVEEPVWPPPKPKQYRWRPVGSNRHAHVNVFCDGTCVVWSAVGVHAKKIVEFRVGDPLPDELVQAIKATIPKD